jgi:hypothetical protein
MCNLESYKKMGVQSAGFLLCFSQVFTRGTGGTSGGWPESSADIFERLDMNIRKIAAAAGFATGAALAFAPLAAADVTPVVDSEISAENSLFETYAALSGDTADITKGGTGVFDTFTTPADLLKDAPQATTFGTVTPLETDLYGANPILAGISSDTGPYSEFNGALSQFYNAYDVLLYASENNGVLDTNTADYIENNALNHALTLSSPTAAAEYLYNFGSGDLQGYDAIFAPATTTVAPTDIDSTLANEIVQLNNVFELDGKLAGDFGDISPHTAAITNVGFDTIPTADLNATLNDLVTGAAGPSSDPGSYDVLNGALTEIYNAVNVEDYSLLNSGALLPVADLFGTHDFLGDGVTAAVGEYLQLGLSDLAGYF